MAWPKGLSRAERDRMHEAGTLEAWLENYYNENPDRRPAAKGSSATPKATRTTATAARQIISSCEHLEALMAKHSATVTAQSITPGEVEEYTALKEALEGVATNARAMVRNFDSRLEAVAREARLAQEKADLEQRNAELEEQLEAMRETMRVAGQGEKAETIVRASKRGGGANKGNLQLAAGA